ncbi:MAG: hypothetical protein K2K57_07890 [Oscillospiraceae bacterium]|nr:hypothetical protein [Oscillospiraceae bacterium]
MYIINPLYAGDISPDSKYENGKITHLVYGLDETWNGDLLIAGTDVFAVGGELLRLLRAGSFKGFELKKMEIRYDGERSLPEFMQLVPLEKLKITRGEYDPTAHNDIYFTDSVGQLAVSDLLFEKTEPHMDKRTFGAEEIFPMDEKTSAEKFEYEYVIVTPSNPFNLLPAEMRRAARRKNGEYIIKGVHFSAPYLECLRCFDIDKHGYMDIYEPYFLAVKGNNREAVLEALKGLIPQSFFIGNFENGFVKCGEFYRNFE